MPLLPEQIIFPIPSDETVDEDGLIAVSDALTTAHLQAAYRLGIFPWIEDQGYFFWFSPTPRAVIEPEKLHVGRSLQKVLRRGGFAVTVNTAFGQVMAACASVPRAGQSGTWITPAFQAAYTDLHRIGYAHSFEYWTRLPENGQYVLSGGLYGVQIGSVFYGESMFSRQSNASKIAFACAVSHLAACGIGLIDCQQDSPHMRRFGTQLWERERFQAALNTLCRRPLKQAVGRGVIQQTGADDFRLPENL